MFDVESALNPNTCCILKFNDKVLNIHFQHSITAKHVIDMPVYHVHFMRICKYIM